MKSITCHIPSMLDSAVITGYAPEVSALAQLNAPPVEALDLSRASDHLHSMRDEHRRDPEQIERAIAKCFPAYEGKLVQAIAYRLTALYMMLEDAALGPWVMLDREARIATIRLPVLQAAIAMPMSMQEVQEGGSTYLYIGFDRGAFLSHVLSFDDHTEAVPV